MIPRIGAAGKPLAVEVPCGAVHYKPRAEYRGRIDFPQPHSAAKGSLLCKQKATTSIAIKPEINNNEIVAAILFALGLSFRDRRP